MQRTNFLVPWHFVKSRFHCTEDIHDRVNQLICTASLPEDDHLHGLWKLILNWAVEVL